MLTRPTLAGPGRKVWKLFLDKIRQRSTDRFLRFGVEKRGSSDDIGSVKLDRSQNWIPEIGSLSFKDRKYIMRIAFSHKTASQKRDPSLSRTAVTIDHPAAKIADRTLRIHGQSTPD